jgi:hypothetical protein
LHRVIAHDEARTIVFDGPGWREVACGHSFLCTIELEHFDGGLVVGLMQVGCADLLIASTVWWGRGVLASPVRYAPLSRR